MLGWRATRVRPGRPTPTVATAPLQDPREAELLRATRERPKDPAGVVPHIREPEGSSGPFTFMHHWQQTKPNVCRLTRQTSLCTH